MNNVYGKAKYRENSIWGCDQDRIGAKKRMIDTLSCVLAKHRTKDWLRMGVQGYSYGGKAWARRARAGGMTDIDKARRERVRADRVDIERGLNLNEEVLINEDVLELVGNQNEERAIGKLMEGMIRELVGDEIRGFVHMGDGRTEVRVEGNSFW